MKRSEAFIGLDVHKETIAVAIADSGRNGEVRYWGTMPNTMHHLGQLVTKLAKKHSRLEFTYEAGPCGYDIYRHLKDKGFACQVIAPSHIPRRAGDRVKNDHRDAVTLARLARARGTDGDLGARSCSRSHAGSCQGQARREQGSQASTATYSIFSAQACGKHLRGQGMDREASALVGGQAVSA